MEYTTHRGDRDTANARFRKAITMKDAKTLLLEFLAAVTGVTGRTVHHLFTGRLVAENGQIKLLRESLNPVAVAQALLPGGIKDLPDPEKVIFSVPPDYQS